MATTKPASKGPSQADLLREILDETRKARIEQQQALKEIKDGVAGKPASGKEEESKAQKFLRHIALATCLISILVLLLVVFNTVRGCAGDEKLSRGDDRGAESKAVSALEAPFASLEKVLREGQEKQQRALEEIKNSVSEPAAASRPAAVAAEGEEETLELEGPVIVKYRAPARQRAVKTAPKASSPPPLATRSAGRDQDEDQPQGVVGQRSDFPKEITVRHIVTHEGTINVRGEIDAQVSGDVRVGGEVRAAGNVAHTHSGQVFGRLETEGVSRREVYIAD